MGKLLVSICISIVFFGCSYKNVYSSSKAYHVVIKNSAIAVADTGFIKKSKEGFNLQVFSAATPILDLHVNNEVCLDYVCLSKDNFNKKFFGVAHYDNLLNDLLLFQPIYDANNITKTQDGFEQKIKNENYDITYKIQGSNLYFKDVKNRILIKLKELR